MTAHAMLLHNVEGLVITNLPVKVQLVSGRDEEYQTQSKNNREWPLPY